MQQYRQRRQSKTSIRDRVRKRAGGKCEACGTKPSRNPGQSNTRGTIHHRLPKRLGGIDSVSNLVLLCYPCHTAIHKDEYCAAEYGFIVFCGDPAWYLIDHAEFGWGLLAEVGHISAEEIKQAG